MPRAIAAAGDADFGTPASIIRCTKFKITRAGGGLLGRAPVVPVNTRSSSRLIAHGGRIPSPLQALIN